MTNDENIYCNTCEIFTIHGANLYGVVCVTAGTASSLRELGNRFDF